MKLSVNYDLPGLVALLEVYDEDPMEVVDNVPVKKEGVDALFKIFTDGNGKYEGKMNIPTSAETVYLYIHLLKLTHTEDELACNDFVTESLTDLCDTERNLHPADERLAQI